MKKLLKKFNFIRAQRFYDRGWAELGKIIWLNHGFLGNGLEDRARQAKANNHVKRANWIYNVCRGRGPFKGTL